ncbi:hypothetical protein LHK_01871 [Laribacter hongkongensis HLHK9]|uniref:Uncharacterized protein n=1 Tax=Laribacter hongkongensis (strain HLHK9) TaxID=557598 RepID=C1D8R5_LARHH|nr:hypothetical protein LHK_01871 [Laribacter hongkongensis HLHK9]
MALCKGCACSEGRVCCLADVQHASPGDLPAFGLHGDGFLARMTSVNDAWLRPSSHAFINAGCVQP